MPECWGIDLYTYSSIIMKPCNENYMTIISINFIAS